MFITHFKNSFKPFSVISFSIALFAIVALLIAEPPPRIDTEVMIAVPILFILFGLGIFVVLLAGKMIVTTNHLGWKRILIIISIVGTILGGVVGYQNTTISYGSNAENVMEFSISCAVGFVVVVCLSLSSASIFQWIKAGFGRE